MTAAETVLAALPDLESDLEDLYTRLHQNPEVSGCETETADLIAERLEGLGFEVQRIGGGVVGVLENGEGRRVLYRADIDALPVKEATGLPYASTKTMEDQDGNVVPVMHACGHDVHITAGIGAAHLLAEHRDAWSGTYIALFQPAEETGWGAKGMLEDGLTSKIPTPQVAFGQHVMAAGMIAGEVATRPGPILSTATSLKITVDGKGSHGSMPHLGIDPVVIAAAIVTRLQSVVAREIAPSDFAVLTVGSLQAGSSANIIPAEAVLQLNVRAYSTEIRDQIVEAITRIVRAECEAGRSPQDPDIEVLNEYPLTENDEALTSLVRDAFVAQLGQDRVLEADPATASEDFSEVPRAFGIPYTYWFLGGFAEGQEQFPNHNPRFAPAIEPTLATGVTAAVTAVLACLAAGE